MIYRVVEEATGRIVQSIDCPPSLAPLYLQPGQILVEAGTTLQLSDEALMVSDGVLARVPGVADIGGYADEGTAVTVVQ